MLYYSAYILQSIVSGLWCSKSTRGQDRKEVKKIPQGTENVRQEQEFSPLLRNALIIWNIFIVTVFVDCSVVAAIWLICEECSLECTLLGGRSTSLPLQQNPPTFLILLCLIMPSEENGLLSHNSTGLYCNDRNILLALLLQDAKGNC